MRRQTEHFESFLFRDGVFDLAAMFSASSVTRQVDDVGYVAGVNNIQRGDRSTGLGNYSGQIAGSVNVVGAWTLTMIEYPGLGVAMFE